MVIGLHDLKSSSYVKTECEKKTGASSNKMFLNDKMSYGLNDDGADGAKK